VSTASTPSRVTSSSPKLLSGITTPWSKLSTSLRSPKGCGHDSPIQSDDEKPIFPARSPLALR
jgi:hypothetical protein